MDGCVEMFGEIFCFFESDIRVIVAVKYCDMFTMGPYLLPVE